MTLSTTPNWFFPEYDRAGVKRDPSEDVLFRQSVTQGEEYAGNDQLGREIIQNSLDAHIGDGPVRVRLSFYPKMPDKDPRYPGNDILTHYFHGLKDAIIAKNPDIEFDGKGIPKIKAGFFVSEDFNTRGLEGDPTLVEDPSEKSEEKRNDFYWFWRNIARSGKGGDDIGRWGLGKTVYRALSQIGCMFGLTVRDSDKGELLMGQAVLTHHHSDGKACVPEGFWGIRGDDGITLPVKDPRDIEEFKKHWHIHRKTGESGLSVVVPYMASELNAEHLAQAVAINFFVRILRGELEVEIRRYDGVKDEPDFICDLKKETIKTECQKFKWGGTVRTKRKVPLPIDFAQECFQYPKNNVVETWALELKPTLDKKSFGFFRYSGGELRSTYMAG